MARGQNEPVRRRLTGAGGGVAGFAGNAQWDYVETDAKIAQDVVTLLEDHRVLYLPAHMEIVESSMHSVQKMREFLTAALQRTTPDSALSNNLRLIRGACRDFQTRIDKLGRERGHPYSEWGSSRFDNPEGVMALGTWRGLVLSNVAELVERYSLAVDGPLLGALPSPE